MPVNRKDTQVDGVEDELLYDPKTAGGLLAAVPKEYSESVLEALALKDVLAMSLAGLRRGLVYYALVELSNQSFGSFGKCTIRKI